jgi:hypothetical protein
VTLGSLQVTCSNHGISLRRPRPPGSTPPVRHEPKPQPVQATTPVTVALPHERRMLELKLPKELLGSLAVEAIFKNLTLNELISKLLMSALKGNGHAHV